MYLNVLKMQRQEGPNPNQDDNEIDNILNSSKHK